MVLWSLLLCYFAKLTSQTISWTLHTLLSIDKKHSVLIIARSQKPISFHRTDQLILLVECFIARFHFSFLPKMVLQWELSRWCSLIETNMQIAHISFLTKAIQMLLIKMKTIVCDNRYQCYYCFILLRLPSTSFTFGYSFDCKVKWTVRWKIHKVFFCYCCCSWMSIASPTYHL